MKKILLCLVGLALSVTGGYAATPTPTVTPTPVGYKTPSPSPTPTPEIKERPGVFIERVQLWAEDETGKLHKIKCSSEGILWNLTK